MGQALPLSPIPSRPLEESPERQAQAAWPTSALLSASVSLNLRGRVFSHPADEGHRSFYAGGDAAHALLTDRVKVKVMEPLASANPPAKFGPRRNSGIAARKIFSNDRQYGRHAGRQQGERRSSLAQDNFSANRQPRNDQKGIEQQIDSQAATGLAPQLPDAPHGPVRQAGRWVAATVATYLATRLIDTFWGWVVTHLLG